MTAAEESEILKEVKKTNEHINNIYGRIDGLKDNQFNLQNSILSLSTRLSDNQSQDFTNNQEIQKQIQTVAKKHGSASGKKWGSIGTMVAAGIVAIFKLWEKFSN